MLCNSKGQEGALMKEERQNAQLHLKSQVNFQKNERTMPDIKNRQNVSSMAAKIRQVQGLMILKGRSIISCFQTSL